MLDQKSIAEIKLELDNAAEFLSACFESSEHADKTLLLGLSRALREICERVDRPPSVPTRDFDSPETAIAETEVRLESFRQSTERWRELGQNRGVHVENLLKIRSEHDEYR